MSTLIDDFSSGPHSVTLHSGSDLNYQSGGMLGGGRWTQLGVAVNLRNQPLHLDTGSGYLNLSVGPEQYVRLEIGYGWLPDGMGGGTPAPLSEGGFGDFLALGSAIRTRFNSADLVAINFNIVAYTATGWGLYGENVVGHPFSPSSFDFPFASFAGNLPPAPDFSRVGFLVFVFQTWSDFVIDAIEIV